MKEISVNISSFEDLRTQGDYIYVDKTEYVYNLVRSKLKNYYFISRPRRYGKSLMCSTLHALFDGKRELFKGLYIDSTDYSFEKYPVLHFDMSAFNVTSYDSFLNDFQISLMDEADSNGIRIDRAEPSTMLGAILKHLDKRAVIIVDEYDTPIIHTYKDIKKADRIRDTLSQFYTVIKSRGDKIRFFFVTGITKFSNMSIFSQMNNLTDLTFDRNCAALLGYTEEELESYFSEYIDEYMKRDDREYKTREEFLSAIRDYYDGYRFSYENPVKVYNPVSVGCFFNGRCSFKNYWINTGASTLAVDLAKDYHLESLISEDNSLDTDNFSTFDFLLLASRKLDKYQVMALLYFTGYLTIKEGSENSLTLTFPNREVRTAFTRSLIKLYSSVQIASYTEKAANAIKENDIVKLIRVMNAYYEQIPYVILAKEIGYQSMFYAFFLLMGVDSIIVEETTTLGRIDVLISTKSDVWVIEIKVDQSADEALNQIKDKRYYGKYINTDKEIHIVGINFSSKTRQIEEWKEELVDKSTEPTWLG